MGADWEQLNRGDLFLNEKLACVGGERLATEVLSPRFTRAM
jgi:hypothetical protein